MPSEHRSATGHIEIFIRTGMCPAKILIRLITGPVFVSQGCIMSFFMRATKTDKLRGCKSSLCKHVNLLLAITVLKLGVCETGILEKLKWESLKKRRRENRLILLYKGLKGAASIPTDDLIPTPQPHTHTHTHLRAIEIITN